MRDELIPGVDRPRRRQYLVAVVIIMLLTIAGYCYRVSGEPLRGPDMETRTSRTERESLGVGHSQ